MRISRTSPPGNAQYSTVQFSTKKELKRQSETKMKRLSDGDVMRKRESKGKERERG